MCSLWSLRFAEKLLSGFQYINSDVGKREKIRHLIQYGVCRVEEIKGFKRGDVEVI
jgi:hypothetical protein